MGQLQIEPAEVATLLARFAKVEAESDAAGTTVRHGHLELRLTRTEADGTAMVGGVPLAFEARLAEGGLTIDFRPS